MATSLLPSIFVPLVGLVFPAVTMAALFLYIEKEEIKINSVIKDLAKIKIDESINHVPLKHKPTNLKRYKLIPEGGRLPEEKLSKELFRKNFLKKNSSSISM